jgi:hypothetical protein
VFSVMGEDDEGIVAALDPDAGALAAESFLAERDEEGGIAFVPVRVENPAKQVATLRAGPLETAREGGHFDRKNRRIRCTASRSSTATRARVKT